MVSKCTDTDGASKVLVSESVQFLTTATHHTSYENNMAAGSEIGICNVERLYNSFAGIFSAFNWL